MIEAMEQQIINSINNRWTKDKNKRREINIDKTTECFRVICSSRNTTLVIINKLKNTNDFSEDLLELKSNMEWIYDWITEDVIQSLLEKYQIEIKDKKKETQYKGEIPIITEFLKVFKVNFIDETLNKLLKFHNIGVEV